MAFDTPPPLTDSDYSILPMTQADRFGLIAAAGDRRIWAGHPAAERYRPEVFEPYFDFLVSEGGAVTLRKGDEIIGCSRFYPVPDQPDAIGIGFTFITCQHWGGSANRAIKTLMTNHAFTQVPEVWFHIAPTNLRSQKATGKLGATFEYQANLDLGTGPTDWMCYRLRPSAEWLRTRDQ